MGCEGKEAFVSHGLFEGGSMTIVLMILTSVYVAAVGLQDIKERKIYSFPSTVLSALWMGKMALNLQMPSYMYLIYLFVCVAFYGVFTVKKIWGAGDSDLFFLFAVVYLACANRTISPSFLIVEILLFMLVLVSALFFGWLEARIKKTKLDKTSSIAVAPGFAIVIISVMISGVMGC